MADGTKRDDAERNRVHHADPENAATDPRAAAQQEQVKKDHDALQDSARRVDASVQVAPGRVDGGTATDPEAARKQDHVKRDHDALAAAARRVESSVAADVRETPIRHADRNAAATTTGDADDARRNADIARDSARRVEASIDDDHPRD